MLTRKILVVLFTVGGLAACATRDARLQLDADQIGAIDRMTAARCERAAACGKPVDPTCFQRLRVQTAEELGLSRCADDVRDDVLNTCVQQLRRQACDDDTGATLFWACRVGALCTSGPDEGTV